MDSVDWIKPGLKFKCTGCGKCCTGTPGYVFLSPTDLDRLVEHTGLSQAAFLLHYTRRIDGQLALLDRPGSNDCVFLKDKRCTVYEGRPTQCRTFPWWLENLSTPSDWNEAASRCEGINHPDAPLVPAEEIEVQLLTYLDNLAE